MGIPPIALVIIFIALIFEFINGFHDTAMAVATSVSTKSLEPFQAISIAAIFNLLGALSGTVVAVTIAKGFADPVLANHQVILSALLAAITWNLLTWYLGLPSSSSHALIGGLVGAIIFNSGFGVIYYSAILKKVVIPMVVLPILGFIIAAIMAVNIHKLLINNKSPRKTNNFIRELQVMSTAFLAFSHGSNDAQKTMGIITLTLFQCQAIGSCVVPKWVIIVCAVCMALGTLSGGLKIIKTLSARVVKLKPASGFAAELSSAGLLFIGSRLGMPLSTTHVVSGSVMGAGSYGTDLINWTIVKNMVFAWVLTFPFSAFLAGLFLHIIKLL